jgi:signal recognition particle receptor subunit beta
VQCRPDSASRPRRLSPFASPLICQEIKELVGSAAASSGSTGGLALAHLLLKWLGEATAQDDRGGSAMVVFNYSGKEINAKIVYYGPGLSGKTTNLEYIYNKTAAHLRGKMVSMKTKADRTLFFDFLPIEGGEIAGFKIRFLLYTVPGQVYYNATRKLVLKGADAIVFVADSQAEELAANRESLKNLEANLGEYGKALGEVPWVIQYNKRDLPTAMPQDNLERELNPSMVQSFQAVATTGEGVYETLNAAAKLVLRELRKQLLQDEDNDEYGGQADTFASALSAGAGEASGAGKEVSSTITDTTPNVPSPGEEASFALATGVACPPNQVGEPGYGTKRGQTAPSQREARAGCSAGSGYGAPPGDQADAVNAAPSRQGHHAGGVAGATIAGTRVDAGHFAPVSGQASSDGGEIAYSVNAGDTRLKIPIKVLGKGKPGHVLVNLAVDVEVIVDEDQT